MLFPQNDFFFKILDDMKVFDFSFLVQRFNMCKSSKRIKSMRGITFSEMKLLSSSYCILIHVLIHVCIVDVFDCKC